MEGILPLKVRRGRGVALPCGCPMRDIKGTVVKNIALSFLVFD